MISTPSKWSMHVMKAAWRSSTQLGCYMRSTQAPVDAAQKRSGDVFPCPPPYPWFAESWKGSRRRASRWARRRSQEGMINMEICALSVCALAAPGEPRSEGDVAPALRRARPLW